MENAEAAITFIVRIASSGAGRLRGVVERVRTGRKEQVHTTEPSLRSTTVSSAGGPNGGLAAPAEMSAR